MAQLTWRNVDSPTFVDVNQAMANAGEALQRGFQASRQAIEGFEKDQTQAQSAQLMAAAMGVKDPSQLAAIIGQFNPGYLSQDALKFAGGRPQDLATLAQTGATTAQTQATTAGQLQTNEFNKEYMPLRIDAAKLGNVGAGIDNATKATSLLQTNILNQRTNNEYAAKPDWVAQQNLINKYVTSGDPEQVAAGRALLADPRTAKLASDAGANYPEFLKATEEAVRNGAQNRNLVNATSLEAQRVSDTLASKQAVADAMSSSANLNQATKAITDNQTLTPAAKTMALEAVAAAAKNFGTPSSQFDATNAAAVLAARAAGDPSGATAPTKPTATVANQPIGTNFTSFGPNGPTPTTQDPNQRSMPSLIDGVKALGLEITSTIRSPTDDLSLKNPRSAHVDGRAIDVRARTPEQADVAMGKLRTMMDGRGLREGVDYRIIDEVRNPSPHATGPHVHVEMLKGGQQSPSDRVTQALTSVNERIAPPNLRGNPGGPVSIGPAQALADSVSPAADTDTFDKKVQTSFDNFQKQYTALNTMSDLNRIDSTLDSEASLVKEMTARPDKGISKENAVIKLFKEIGDNNQGGWIAANGLTSTQLGDDMNKVIARHGVTPDIAAALIKNAIVTNPETFGPDVKAVDHSQIAKQVDKYINKAGAGKGSIKDSVLRGGLGILNSADQKKQIEEQITQLRDRLTTAKQDYQDTLARALNNPKINVDKATLAFKAIQAATDKQIGILSAKPHLTAYSNGLLPGR